MKNILPFLFFLFAGHAFSQVNAVLPSEAKTFYEKAMLQIKPEVKTLIEKNANKLSGQKINVDSLVKELKKNPVLKDANESCLQAIAILVLVQVSEIADSDLKQLVIRKRQSDAANENDAEKERDKNYASRLVENKSDIALAVSFMMERLPATPEIVMDKFK
jgi:hypothetical protein